MTDRLRSERRAAIRRHHPDAGGSAEALVAALSAVERAATPSLLARTRRARARRMITRLQRRMRRTNYIVVYAE